MIDADNLYIVNYCHPNCTPLKNIFRLPKEEAFSLAFEMSESNPNDTAFGRFADFENYYPLRMKADELLYTSFVSLGGKPETEHPLSFVLNGSEYLHNWFGNGIITKLLLKNISHEHISFTFGDSSAVYNKTGDLSLVTKEELLQIIRKYDGTIDEFMDEIQKNHYYIEVQLWSDGYF